MTRRMSYKAPSLLVIDTTTPERQDDTDRGSLWTKSEVAWLMENYMTLGGREAAKVLRRSELSVRIKAHRLRRGQKMGSVSMKQ